MFCTKCGNKLKEDWRVCPNCGQVVKNGVTNMEVRKNNNFLKKQNFDKKRWMIGGIVIFIIFILLISGDSTDADEIIQRLQQFTYMEREELSDGSDIYIFNNSEKWYLKYSDVNECVEITEGAVLDCLAGYCGTVDLDNVGIFTYDLDENAIRIYFDYEASDGTISNINYDIDKDKFTGIIDGERYSLSEEFVNYIKDYGLIDIMKNDIKEFENELQENNMSIEEVTYLESKDIKKYLEKN